MNQVNVMVENEEGVAARFMAGVYGWMTIGLGLTGFIAYWFGTSGLVLQVIGNKWLFFGLLMGELILVIILCSAVRHIGAITASMLFLVYSAANGVTLSTVFLQYSKASISSTFFICAATFGVFSLYGLITKKDLTPMGNFMFMGLVGILIAMVANLFMRSPAIDFIVSAIGVIVFVGLTAHDTQKLKEIGGFEGSLFRSGRASNAAIMGALTLYLNFMNLFLFMLRFLGAPSTKD